MTKKGLSLNPMLYHPGFSEASTKNLNIQSENWKLLWMAAVAYSKGERAHASYLSEKGKFYGKLAREADEKASREIFEASFSESLLDAVHMVLVIGLVQKEGIEWSEDNPGTLVLRIDGLKEYSFMTSDSDSE
ncbi:hypothetical protein Taro_040385 [Colocasia esculenta]|uniref:DUF1771 domain-containing protein n=1 Tax=Colocasia esculenta TaxID=4460 RepID=A0A843WLR7_COLES|nr:hypothetical protein [Colocasia esculenta]